jgi:hypothetical protein
MVVPSYAASYIPLKAKLSRHPSYAYFPSTGNLCMFYLNHAQSIVTKIKLPKNLNKTSVTQLKSEYNGFSIHQNGWKPESKWYKSGAEITPSRDLALGSGEFTFNGRDKAVQECNKYSIDGLLKIYNKK